MNNFGSEGRNKLRCFKRICLETPAALAVRLNQERALASLPCVCRQMRTESVGVCVGVRTYMSGCLDVTEDQNCISNVTCTYVTNPVCLFIFLSLSYRDTV